MNQEDDDEVTEEDYKAVVAPRFQIAATNTEEIDQPLGAAIPPRNIFNWVWSLFNWFTSRNEKAIEMMIQEDIDNLTQNTIEKQENGDVDEDFQVATKVCMYR